MRIVIQEYTEFNNENIQKIIEKELGSEGNSNNVMLVFDSISKFSITLNQMFDLNKFKVLTWKQKLQDKIGKLTIFKIQKLSPDFIYTFFRNEYEIAYIFTDDINNANKIFTQQSPNVEIVYSDKFEDTKLEGCSLELIKAYIDRFCNAEEKNEVWDRMRKYYVEYTKLIQYSAFKLNHTMILAESKEYEDYKIYILSDNDFLFKDNKLINARQRNILVEEENLLSDSIKRPKALCIVLDFDIRLSYTKFDKYCFILNNNVSSIQRVPTIEEFELIKRLFEKERKFCELLNLTYRRFCDYLTADNQEILEKVVIVTSPEPRKHENLKLAEVNVGVCNFPITYARQLLDAILIDIRAALESNLLFVRSLLPTLITKQGGFMNKEYKTIIKIPSLFDNEVESSFFFTKKDTVNDASFKMILFLHKNNFLNDNLDVIPDSLLELPAIRKLFIQAYGTSEMPDIKRQASDYMQNSKVSEKLGHIIEKNQQVKFSLQNENSLVFNSLKKKFVVENKDNSEKSRNISALNKSNLDNYFFPECPITQLERCYRKIPESFKVKNNKMALYVFNNSSIGVLCHETLKNSCSIKNKFGEKIIIENCNSNDYCEKKIQLLTFFQILFFKHMGEVYPTANQTFKLFYYAVPIKSNEKAIDWDYIENCFNNFFQSRIYESPLEVLTRQLAYDQFSKDFVLYLEPFEKNLEDQIQNYTYKEYFEKKYNINLVYKTGSMMFRGLLACLHLSGSKITLKMQNHPLNISKVTKIF